MGLDTLAVEALNGMDESSHESLLAAIQDKEKLLATTHQRTGAKVGEMHFAPVVAEKNTKSPV